jgi:hypothetical protein
MHQYWGFGLLISSEIEFPELLPFTFTDEPDLTIKTGKAPTELTGEGVVKKVQVSMNATQYLQKTAVASYYVTNGHEILFEPVAEADEKSVRLFLLSNAMVAALHQRGAICLHASAIIHHDGIVLFCGASRSGKSTTATMLQQKGHKVFSDDVCVLQVNGDEINAVPSYPMVKLWADSFQKIGLDRPNENEKIRPRLAKFARFYHDAFDIAPKPIRQIFWLATNRAATEVSIKSLPSIAAFAQLQYSSYRPVQMNDMQKRNQHFTTIARLTNTTPVYEITRPLYDNTLTQVIDRITNVIEPNEYR